MKQLQYITTFGLIVALTGLSPLVAADAGSTISTGGRIQTDQRGLEESAGYKLSTEQMDNVYGGATVVTYYRNGNVKSITVTPDPK